MPKMTQDNYKVMINRLIDFDPEKVISAKVFDGLT